MITPILLILLGTLTRLAPHPPNAVAMGALALYAGARLPRVWAVLIPLAAMAASDICLDWGQNRPVFDLIRISIYGSFAATALLGRVLRNSPNLWLRPVMAVVSSSLFFLVTNFTVWYVSSGQWMSPPRSLAGLGTTYLMGVPFFGNTLAADLIGTAVLFGLDAWARDVFAARPSAQTNPLAE